MTDNAAYEYSSTKIIAQTSTDWNACSLEALFPSPDENFNSANKNRLPELVVIGCYQLLDNAPADYEVEGSEKVDFGDAELDIRVKNQQRLGQLRLYSINNSSSQKTDITFGQQPQIYTLNGGGVLDMKWLPYRVNVQETFKSLRTEDVAINGEMERRKKHVLASALSSGSIQLHSLEESFRSETKDFHLRCIASSKPAPGGAICLSLDWEQHIESNTGNVPPSSSQIVSSYSNGQVAIHSVRWREESTSSSSLSVFDGDKGRASPVFEESLRFDAHALCGAPSEVWTSCWCRCSSATTILSGADDGNLKGWDVRVSTNKPVFCIKDHEAGVTAVSWHPTQPFVFASGSYDESVRIWDIRSVSDSKQHYPLAKLSSCGGGVWRMKWHPKDSTKLLVAAMHGGCRVLKIDALHKNGQLNSMRLSEEDHVRVVSSFIEHKSMAYGADWLPVKVAGRDADLESMEYLAVSCSFYDQQAFIWDTCS